MRKQLKKNQGKVIYVEEENTAKEPEKGRPMK
jgi:hypothetical protein